MVAPLFRVLAAAVLGFFVGRFGFGQRGQATLQNVTAEVAEHLYAPPPRHGDVAVPSTIDDARGKVHNLRVGGYRFNVLESRAGTSRSGDVHGSRQYDVIFSGRVQVTTRERARDVMREYGGGEMLVIPAHVPHIFRTSQAGHLNDDLALLLGVPHAAAAC